MHDWTDKVAQAPKTDVTVIYKYPLATVTIHGKVVRFLGISKDGEGVPHIYVQLSDKAGVSKYSILEIETGMGVPNEIMNGAEYIGTYRRPNYVTHYYAKLVEADE